MFTTLDTLILQKFQKFSDSFQDITGLNNFWITRMCVLLLCLTYLFLDLPNLLNSLVNGIFTPFLSAALFTLIIVLLFWYVQRAEVGCLRNKSAKNELEHKLMSVRINFIFVTSPTMIWVIIGLIGNPKVSLIDQLLMSWLTVLMGCGVYFLCCTPKPPKTSKVKKFIEKLSRSIVPKQVVVQTVTT